MFERITLLRRMMLTLAAGATALLVCAALLWSTGQAGRNGAAALGGTVRATAALADAQSAVWALRWGVANFLATTDAAARAKVVADSVPLRESFDKAMKTFEASELKELERGKLAELRKAFGVYADTRLEFFRRMSSGDAEGATALRTGKLSPAGAATSKAFGELIELQRRLAADDTQALDGALAGRIWWGLAVAAVALVTSLAVGLLVARSLMRQLGGEPAHAVVAARRIAGGDLTRPIHCRAGDGTSLMAAMHAMQSQLSELIGQVHLNSDSIATASAQIAQGNQDLSGRTEQQASALQQTASTMEELGTTVRNNADSARQANQLAQSASAVAGQGGKVVGQVVTTMQSINDSSRKIGDIISVIDGIAFQTNILALNAAVEAARAGEQGRGFAVVASEVRSLAQRSAEAAKEIKALIGRSVEQVEQGTVLVDQAGKTMGEIVGSIQRVSDIVAEITSASAEQSSGVQQVGLAITQMDQATQQNAALVEQTAAAAESLNGQARLLVQALDAFKSAKQG